MGIPGDTLIDRLTAEDIDVSNMAVRLTALFGAVSSYAADVAEPGLRAVHSPAKPVRIAAAEEHHATFSLTDIASASDGAQIFLPRGPQRCRGGYPARSDEVDMQVLDMGFTDERPGDIFAKRKAERAWLRESGRYADRQLTVRSSTAETTLNRRRPPNRYQHIPPHIMAWFPRNNGLAIEAAVARSNPVGAGLQLANADIWAAERSHPCGTPGAGFGKDPAEHPAPVISRELTLPGGGTPAPPGSVRCSRKAWTPAARAIWGAIRCAPPRPRCRRPISTGPRKDSIAAPGRRPPCGWRRCSNKGRSRREQASGPTMTR
jgi:hypothetical protein